MKFKKEKLMRYTGLIAGFVTLCASLAALFIYSREGNLLFSIIFGGLSWLGYTAAHYADTGRLLDAREDIEEHIEQKDSVVRGQKIKASSGIVIFVAGAALLAKGVSAESFILSFTGACGAIGGYAVFHYLMEGEFF